MAVQVLKDAWVVSGKLVSDLIRTLKMARGQQRLAIGGDKVLTGLLSRILKKTRDKSKTRTDKTWLSRKDEETFES